LRCTAAEKEELKRNAAMAGLSIPVMLRGSLSLIKPSRRRPAPKAARAMTRHREPLPEVPAGGPERTRLLIDACPHQWSYRSGVISFAAEDAPDEAQQRRTMEAFEDLAFAGLERDQVDMLWVRHRHEGRVELHFLTPP
jgi:hypothetical protein